MWALDYQHDQTADGRVIAIQVAGGNQKRAIRGERHRGLEAAIAVPVE